MVFRYGSWLLVASPTSRNPCTPDLTFRPARRNAAGVRHHVLRGEVVSSHGISTESLGVWTLWCSGFLDVERQPGFRNVRV